MVRRLNFPKMDSGIVQRIHGILTMDHFLALPCNEDIDGHILTKPDEVVNHF